MTSYYIRNQHGKFLTQSKYFELFSEYALTVPENDLSKYLHDTDIAVPTFPIFGKSYLFKDDSTVYKYVGKIIKDEKTYYCFQSNYSDYLESITALGFVKFYVGEVWQVPQELNVIHDSGFTAEITGKKSGTNTLWRPAGVLKKCTVGKLVKYHNSFYQNNNNVVKAYYKVPYYRYPVVVWFDKVQGRRIA